MKLINDSLLLFTMLVLGSAGLLGGCATTGMDRSIKTSNSIEEVDKDIRNMVAKSDVTAKSLDALVKAGKTEYFAEWEKQGDAYKNQQIRELSEERRIKLAEIYAKVHTAGGGIA